MRPAEPGDVAALHAIAEAAYAPYVGRIGRKPAPMTADFAAHVARAEVWVCETPEDGVVGYIVTFAKGGGQFVENMAVAPEIQGRGLGRALLGFAGILARRNRCDRLFLYTNAAMAENIAFYARLGFAETRRVHEDGFDRVDLEKPLDPPPDARQADA